MTRAVTHDLHLRRVVSAHRLVLCACATVVRAVNGSANNALGAKWPHHRRAVRLGPWSRAANRRRIRRSCPKPEVVPSEGVPETNRTPHAAYGTTAESSRTPAERRLTFHANPVFFLSVGMCGARVRQSDSKSGVFRKIDRRPSGSDLHSGTRDTL